MGQLSIIVQDVHGAIQHTPYSNTRVTPEIDDKLTRHGDDISFAVTGLINMCMSYSLTHIHGMCVYAHNKVKHKIAEFICL